MSLRPQTQGYHGAGLSIYSQMYTWFLARLNENQNDQASDTG